MLKIVFLTGFIDFIVEPSLTVMSDAIESLMRALQQQCAAVAPASGPEDGSKCGTGDSSQNDFATPPTPKSPHFPGMLDYFFRQICLENYTCDQCDSHILIPVQSCHYSSANSCPLPPKNLSLSLSLFLSLSL